MFFGKKAEALKAENEKLRMELERVNQLLEETIHHASKMENAVEDRERRLRSFADQLENAEREKDFLTEKVKLCLDELKKNNDDKQKTENEELKRQKDLSKQWEELSSYTGERKNDERSNG